MLPNTGPGRAGHLHLGRLPLEQGLVEQLVELVLVLRGVHHSVSQVLKPQPPARVGEGGVVSLQGVRQSWAGGMGLERDVGLGV